jgi:hypothetical protein
MCIYYECHPISDLRVIPAANIITRACLEQCFFDGISQYHTIPRKFSHHEVRHFAGGRADKAVPCGDASKLYELNVWAMTCGRAKERTCQFKTSLLQREGTYLRPMLSAAWHYTLVTHGHGVQRDTLVQVISPVAGIARAGEETAG